MYCNHLRGHGLIRTQMSVIDDMYEIYSFRAVQLKMCVGGANPKQKGLSSTEHLRMPQTDKGFFSDIENFP